MRCRPLLVVVLVVVMGIAAGCGDPLVNSEYRGEQLFSFSGQVASVDGVEVPQGEVRVSLFWGPGGDVEAPAEQLIEQASVSASLEFPSNFALSVFHPPEERHLVADGSHGIATLLVYDDRDRDGRYDNGDEILGGAGNKLMVYAAKDLSRSASPTGSALAAGFRLISAPQICAGLAVPDFEDDEDSCDVELGAPCAKDSDCGGVGRCLTAIEGLHFQGGYCAMHIYDACWLEDDDRDEFEQEFPDGPPDDEPGLYVYKPCTTDSHCRVDEGYLCHGDEFACLPDEPVFLDLHSEFEVPPLCAEQLSDFDDHFDDHFDDEDFDEEEPEDAWEEDEGEEGPFPGDR